VDFDGYVKFGKGFLHLGRSLEELLIELGDYGIVLFGEDVDDSSKSFGCSKGVFF
jgi:hypothetical protein